MSKSLRRELMLFGIDVIIVAPGAVATPIWDKANAFLTPFANTPYEAALNRIKENMIASGRERLAPGETRRAGKNGAHRPEAEDPLHGDAESDSGPVEKHNAETHRRQHHRASAGAEIAPLAAAGSWRRARAK